MALLSSQPQSHSRSRRAVSRWVHAPLLLFVALLVILLPLVPTNLSSPTWHGAKTLVFELGAALLLGLSPWVGPKIPSVSAWKRHLAPLLFLAALSFWAFASFMISPNPNFAFNGWWLIFGGFIISCTVATQTTSENRLLFVLNALTLASALIAFCSFAFYQSAGMKVAEGTYHDHQLLGATLMILMPMTLITLILPGTLGKKLLAMAAFVMGALGLLIAQDRSAWVGETVGLLVFGAVFVWVSVPTWKSKKHHQKLRLQVRQQTIVYGILIVIILGYFCVAAPQTDLLKGRAQTLFTTVLTGQDDSMEWRLGTWQGALNMFQAKPYIGWGIGSYPVYEQAFTGHGDDTTTVLAYAAHIGDETHNSYLQYAVELGVLGLALWLLTLGAAFWNGFRALRWLPEGSVRQRLLMGGLAALAGQAVDAFANPAWQFGEITIYLWVILGLVVSASASPDTVASSTEAGQEASRHAPDWAKRLFQISVSAFSLWAGIYLLAAAHDLTIPSL
jgi:O-antigen ligase